ncbi:MAG: helix-turn-helix domain-containing protein [Gemmatimonadales bacterium]|nr:helix-turn-helix domain-containing protein [Candidatus Neomarinimicrobiota bacterium]MBT7125870.1 helix-turn-helix domain-containing protein [Gemmatimonadales bacterium]
MKLLLTVDEAVEFLGGVLSEASVRRRCRDGTFPARRVGHVWLISTEGLYEAVGLGTKAKA